jgi:hypothetical protein
LRIGASWRGFLRACCLCNLSIRFLEPFRDLCLCPPKSGFPTVETGVAIETRAGFCVTPVTAPMQITR